MPAILRRMPQPTFGAALAAMTALSLVPARADTPPAATPGTIEDVTVTADRRAQSAQSLGASVSVISGSTLAARNVNNLFDLQYLTPSLQVTPQFGSGQLAYSIRGVGFSDYASNNAPTVGLYIDEVAYPVPFETNGLLFDVKRVEVLRGPQGTLYGRNTTGGAINYVLNQPTRTLHAGISAQYGSFNATKVDGFVSGPITPNLQYRVAGETQRGGAWQHGPDGQLLGNADRTALRALLNWEPNDSLTIKLNLHGSRDRSDALGTHLYAPLTALSDLGLGPVTPYNPARNSTDWGTSSAFANLVGIRTNTKPYSHIDTGGLSLRADQTTGLGTLSDLVSYDYAQRDEYDNFDASSLELADVVFRTRATTVANELRLTSPGTGRLTYVAGIYYGHQFLTDGYFGGFNQIYGLDTATRYGQTVDTISGFGQATYKLTDKLSAIGGLRIEHESRDLTNFSSYFIADNVITNPNNTVGRQSLDYTKPSGKIELEYKPLKHDLLYVQVSHGVKSGGFTTYNSASPQIGTAPFKPETLWAYEIGNKATIPAAHLQINLSAFHYQYRNQQIQSAVVNPQTGLIGSIVNAPRSHVYGGELELRWNPTPNLTLTQSFAEAYGRFDRFNSVTAAVLQGSRYVAVTTNLAGEALPSPKFTVNGSASYDFHLPRYIITVGGDYSIRSTYYSLFGPLYNVAGYTLFNAHVSLSPNNARWTLTAFGQNILNKGYDIDRNFFDTGDDIATAGMPATWGVKATVGF